MEKDRDVVNGWDTTVQLILNQKGHNTKQWETHQMCGVQLRIKATHTALIRTKNIPFYLEKVQDHKTFPVYVSAGMLCQLLTDNHHSLSSINVWLHSEEKNNSEAKLRVMTDSPQNPVQYIQL